MTHSLELYKTHKESWKDCERCHLSGGRSRVVLARGTVPCDVMFVGEAPGESEDVLGKPFVGPADKLLDYIVRKSLRSANIRTLFTNLVGCIPRDEDGGKATEPDDEAVLECQPRLVELCDIARPKLIVCVGALARDWFDRGYRHSIKLNIKPHQIDVTHPAAILRANVAQKGLMIQRCIVLISNAWEDVK